MLSSRPKKQFENIYKRSQLAKSVILIDKKNPHSFGLIPPKSIDQLTSDVPTEFTPIILHREKEIIDGTCCLKI